ncbi:hypothetical protein JB92DRAFT_1256198 [Gautieria morchelliformis]|nr:hypothetical protein JB92DRAFT_1256198 [Gautieria morchelliformis]
MGNSVSGSKDRQIDETVDFGFLSPQGVYTGPQDWNQQVVGHLIVDRKLAPFYRPLEEYDDSWDDDRILAARKGNPNAPPPPPPDLSASASSTSKFHHHKNANKTGKETFRPTEASVYRGAVECPICFLYYPSNINRSRCCDQAICTECFVQIKRAEPTTTHLVSEPASCPYCVQENFGVTYNPPPWRIGLVKDGQIPTSPNRPDMPKMNSASTNESTGSKRRKSFSADSTEVVTIGAYLSVSAFEAHTVLIDQIRPDWEAKLAAVRAAVTRRANRRIVMRQVGDRLIPIGVTSGRVMEAADATANAEGGESGSGRRRRRGHGGQDINQILGSVGLGGLGGQDLEELMVMEAMRLSLVEHEEQQRRQNNTGDNDSTRNASGNVNSNGNDASPAPTSSPSPRSSPPPLIDSPVPRPHSPSPAANDQSPRQSPPRSRFFLIPSPLGSSDVTSGTQPTLAPPPSRTHRRTGSSPGPPSGSTLAAALTAAQTASAFLSPSEGRQLPSLPRSAPQTRATSPTRSGPGREREGGTGRGTEGEILQREPVGLPSAVIPPFEGASGGGAAASGSESSSALVTGPEASTASPISNGGEEASSQVSAGYQALTSSSVQSSSDPLLGWDR